MPTRGTGLIAPSTGEAPRDTRCYTGTAQAACAALALPAPAPPELTWGCSRGFTPPFSAQAQCPGSITLPSAHTAHPCRETGAPQQPF